MLSCRYSVLLVHLMARLVLDTVCVYVQDLVDVPMPVSDGLILILPHHRTLVRPITSESGWQTSSNPHFMMLS